MRSRDPLHPPGRDRTFSPAGSASICSDITRKGIMRMVCSRQRDRQMPTVLYPLVEACDVLPLLLLPELIGLQLKVSNQLHGRHLPPTQRRNLTWELYEKYNRTWSSRQEDRLTFAPIKLSLLLFRLTHLQLGRWLYVIHQGTFDQLQVMGGDCCDGPFVAHVFVKLGLEKQNSLAFLANKINQFWVLWAYLSHEEPLESVPGF